MPFICSLCGIEIAVGEAMIPNIRDEVAHDRCVQNEGLLRQPEAPSDIILPPPPPAPPPPPLVVAPDFHAPSRSKICAICEAECISACPYCMTMVCHTYGWNGKSCSLIHEAKCAGARESREPLKKPLALKPMEVFYDAMVIASGVNKNSNGKHQSKPRRKKKGTRK